MGKWDISNVFQMFTLQAKCVVMLRLMFYLPNFVVVPAIWRPSLFRQHSHCCTMCIHLDTQPQWLAPIPSFPIYILHSTKNETKRCHSLSLSTRIGGTVLCCFVASDTIITTRTQMCQKGDVEGALLQCMRTASSARPIIIK